MDWHKIKCFVLDMDGTIYLGDKLFDFTRDFLAKVEASGRRYYFFTNNSSKSQTACVDKLAQLGIGIRPEQMMIASHVMIKFLQENQAGQKIFVMGTDSLLDEFRRFNMPLVASDETPEIVVIGFDTQLTYAKLCRACAYVRRWRRLPSCSEQGKFFCALKYPIKIFREV